MSTLTSTTGSGVRLEPDASGEKEGLALQPGEAPEAGIARVWYRLVDSARNEHGRTPLATEIHSLRVATKRLRALLRLQRAGLDEENYRRENELLRDAARTLAPLRDRQIAIKRLEALRRKHAGKRTRKAIAHAIANLEEDVGRSTPQSGMIPKLYTAAAVRALEESLLHMPSNTKQLDSETLVQEGLGQTYRRARRQLALWKKTGDPSDAHQLRKYVKALMFQLEFLTPISPGNIGASQEKLLQLERKLGRHHDLDNLDRIIRCLEIREPFTKKDRKKIRKLFEKRARKFEKPSLRAGRKFFSRSPAKFVATMKKHRQDRESGIFQRAETAQGPVRNGRAASGDPAHPGKNPESVPLPTLAGEASLPGSNPTAAT